MTFLHPNPSAVYRHILSPFPINVKGYPSRSMASRDLAGQFGTLLQLLEPVIDKDQLIALVHDPQHHESLIVGAHVVLT